MNSAHKIEIMQKKETKLTVLSIVFVGFMVFLVPSLAEEAQALIDGSATIFGGTFSDIKGKMDRGVFVVGPTLNGNTIHWVTIGNIVGFEEGEVTANVGQNKVLFHFENPPEGANECDSGAVPIPNISITCTITQGNFPDVHFQVIVKQQNTNIHCDLLNKLGGLDQSKLIREKLHC